MLRSQQINANHSHRRQITISIGTASQLYEEHRPASSNIELNLRDLQERPPIPPATANCLQHSKSVDVVYRFFPNTELPLTTVLGLCYELQPRSGLIFGSHRPLTQSN